MAMTMIIDPPVSWYSAREDIEAWIVQLEDLQGKYAADGETVAQIRESLHEARRWLRASVKPPA